MCSEFDWDGVRLRLLEARRRKGLTQGQMVELTGVKAYGKYERGTLKTIPLCSLVAIACKAGVSLDWLANGRGEPCQE